MKVIVNDQLIEYFDEGSGDAVLMLHGWGANLNTFDSLAERLSKKYRIIRFDFPGFGQSPKPNDNWSIDDYAKATADFLKKIKVDKLYAVISHSFGGRVTIKGVSCGYLNPKKIVLMGSAGVKPKKTIKMKLIKVIAKLGKAVTALPGLRNIKSVLQRRLYGSIGSTDYLNAGQMKNIFKKVIAEDLLPDATKITSPTLLIWGQNDIETPLHDAKLIHAAIKNSRLATIENAGHFVYLDDEDDVAKLLDSFLK